MWGFRNKQVSATASGPEVHHNSEGMRLALQAWDHQVATWPLNADVELWERHVIGLDG